MEVQILIIVILSLVIFFAIALFIMSRDSKKWNNLLDESGIVFGLSRISTPEPAFLERVLSLIKKSDARAEVKKVFFGDRLDYQIYLFDLYQWSEDDNTALPSSTIFITSSNLNLPRFALHPKLNLTGMLGSALSNSLNKHIDSTLPQGMTKIAVETHPEFDKKYALFGAEPFAVRETFSDYIITQLSQTERYNLEAQGDGLMFSNMNFGVERLGGRVKPEQIKTLLEEATRLYELFKSRRNH